MSKTYYKVVYDETAHAVHLGIRCYSSVPASDKLWSWKLGDYYYLEDIKNDKCIVEYTPHKWVKAPDNTRLFVFDNLKDAMEYAKPSNTKSSIWECKIRGGIPFKGAISINKYAEYWAALNKILASKKAFNPDAAERYLTDVLNITLWKTPAVLAKSVKLTKKLYIP